MSNIRKQRWGVLALVTLCGIVGVASLLLLKPLRITAVELPTVTGTRISIPGKQPSWVSFWSASCPPCLREIPSLDRLYHAYQGKVQFVAISVPYDPPNIVKETQERLNLSLPLALDLDGKVAAQFGGDLLVPSHYLVDAHGNVLLTLKGELSEAAIRDMISQHL